MGLLPGGSVTPRLHEETVHLGGWMPFAKAAAMIERLRRVRLSESTVRRMTQEAGTISVRQQEQAVERLEREAPPSPPGAETMLLSVDGAMVPLVGGEWAEVKTLTVGEVEAARIGKGEPEVHTTAHSTYSRLADAETFTRGALLEIHRRGVNAARTVAAPADGAEWIEGFVGYHCPQAQRILDFPHAAERLSTIGPAIEGEGPEAAQTWAASRGHALKHDGPGELLEELRAWAAGHPEATDALVDINYLVKREGQMAYPTYRAAGLPIGSGAAESSNKVVVEDRLKGAGMHWARGNVNPMLAVRNAICSDRFDEAIGEIQRGIREATRERSRERRHQRAADRLQETAVSLATVLAEVARTAPVGAEPGATTEAERPPRPSRPHPWRTFNPGFLSRR